MSFINQYPYSDFHELNIDWVIKQVKTNIKQIDYLKEELAKIEVMTEDQIREMINTSILDNNILIYADMNNLKESITNEYRIYIDNKIREVNVQLQNLKAYVDNQDAYYDNLAKEYNVTTLAAAKSYVDTKVLDYTMMINPITGQYEDVRNVVNDIVTYFHTEGSLTAGEYDALDLTAQNYDDYELTAYEYDFEGKTRLT